MAVLSEVIAADELPTAHAARVTFLAGVAAAVTRQLVGPSKPLLAVGPRTKERLLTFSSNTSRCIVMNAHNQPPRSCPTSLLSAVLIFCNYSG